MVTMKTRDRQAGESHWLSRASAVPRSLTPIGPPVLVVDDDDAIRESLALVLRDEGYAVLEARDGIEALNQLAEMRKRCVIFLDLLMPRMDGIEVCARLMTEPMLRRDHPVILMSAWFHHAAAGAGIESARLSKPFDIETVLELASRFSTSDPLAE